MNDNTKKFFEKLAQGGINDEETEKPLELEIVKENELSDDIFEEPEGQLAIDVYQTANSIIIESAIAGVDADNLDIEISPESVTIKGTRDRTEKVRGSDYLYQECYWGRFARAIILPQEIDPDKASAALKNGILKISLPKLNKLKSKKIKVKFE